MISSKEYGMRAEYGEGPSLDSHKNRYTERFTEFMPNGGVRRLQRHGLKADGEYGKIDNHHIHYEGNRIKEVLEDAGPTVQTGSTDFPGKTGVRSSFEYNSWGALVRDDGRNISSIAYDNLGNPVGVNFNTSDASEAKYVYSAKGDRLRAEHLVNVTVQTNPVSKAPQMSGGTSVGDASPVTPNLFVKTRLEYHGPVVYRNGKVDRVLFSGGYATIDGGNVTFHYYTQDHQGSNRAVVNGTTGAVEQTVAYYPYGGVIADLGTGAGIQPCKFGGKELTLYNGLDEYDFGARQYYPAVPHFTRIDPKCEDYYWLSPYLYCANDPVNNIDPNGEDIVVLNYGNDITHQHLAMLIQNEDSKWQYYSINGNNVYIPFTDKHTGGRPFNDVSVGSWNSPQEFLNSSYNERTNDSKEDKSKNNFGFSEGYQISTTSEQDAIMRNSFTKIAKTDYNLFTNNCATAVQQAMVDAGIPVSQPIMEPSTKPMHTPFGLVDVFDGYKMNCKINIIPSFAFKSIIKWNPTGKFIHK